MDWIQLGIKRAMDITLSLLLLILGLPLFAAVAVLIRLSSPGPIFFVQQRVGQDKRVFRMVKFRTMTGSPTGEGLRSWTQHEEARITRPGKFLRDFGLDELPQVVNILKGDMSIVGPRPPLPAQIADYTERHRLAFGMRPGVLSWAAVKGRRSLPLDERRELHAMYVEKWSLKLDIEILLRSLLVVLRREDASEKIPGAYADMGEREHP